MANCLPPGQFFATGKLMQSFSELVERIVQKHYCGDLTFHGLGACAPFIPPTLGGARSEFFDEDAGVHRCKNLASFLKFHNSHVNEQTVESECLATNPKPLKVKVPDIISHRFARMEFYEIKPNSVSSINSGAEKIGWFNFLCDPLVANLQYKAGTQYKPGFSFPISLGTSLGAPFRIAVHVFRPMTAAGQPVEGLILYEICPTTNRPRQDEKCGALMRAGALAAVVRLRTDAVTAAALFESLIPLAESPLQGAVGRATGAGPAPNLFDDVIYVQSLLSDWRARNGLAPIAEDGDFGNETDGAIITFQQAVTGFDDGRIDPGGPAIQALEQGHLRAALGAVEAAIAEASLPAAPDPIIYHDSDDGEADPDPGEPITPAELLLAMHEEMRGYLRLLY